MKLLMAALLSFLYIDNMAKADDGHNHEAAVEAAPRGGMLRDVLPHFKSELVIEKELVKLFIYDTKLVLLTPDKETLKGRVQFPREKKPRAVVFKIVKPSKPTDPTYYETKIAKIDKVHRFDLHVTLELGDKKGMADFGVDNIH